MTYLHIVDTLPNDPKTRTIFINYMYLKIMQNNYLFPPIQRKVNECFVITDHIYVILERKYK